MAEQDGTATTLTRLTKFLRCPSCRGPMHINEQSVICIRGHTFAIRRGVPRLIEPLASDHEDLDSLTSQAFGEQWNQMGEIASVNSVDLNLHVPTGWSPTELFHGSVLDAGCGMGRYSALVAELGCEVVGLDLSNAVDKAAELWDRPMFVQGDVFKPPLSARSFDLVYSFGVLHHLSDPVVGFRSCFELVKPGGVLLVWVYSKHNGVLRRARRNLRSAAHQFPSVRRPLAGFIAGALWLGLILPPRVLGRRGILPFYSDKKFGQLYVDCHDALVAPLEHYLDADDCMRCLAAIDKSEGGFERRRDGSGWIIWARSPRVDEVSMRDLNGLSADRA